MIFNKKSMWKKPTLAQREDKEKRVEMARQSISEAKEAAALCLESPLFKEYLRKLERGQDGIISLFEAVDLADPMQEWKVFKELQKEYIQLGFILRNVNRDASVTITASQKVEA